MFIYKTKTFARFAKRENLTDASLIDAVERVRRGLVDAQLGGGIIKQRLGREGHGRRGGYRTLIAFRAEELAVFLFGFAKNEQENIDTGELMALRLVGAQWFDDAGKIAMDLRAGILIEVKHGDKNN